MSGYIEKRRQGFYAVLEVPPHLRAAAGCNKKRRTLGTTDKHVANARLGAVLGELHKWLDGVRRKKPDTDPLVAEAMGWRETLKDAREGKGVPSVLIEDNYGLLQEVPDDTLVLDMVAERGHRIERSEGPTRAGDFADIAMGRATLTTTHIEEWLSEPGQRGPYRSRTAADYRSIVKTFAGWSTKDASGAIIEKVSRRSVALYLQHLQTQGISATRIRTIIAALSGYWMWMEKRGGIAQGSHNPWERQAPRKPLADGDDAKERAFTDEEMKTLLTGTTDTFLLDFMRIGALTGMRIEEIARLTVGMCKGDVIRAPGVKGNKVVVPRDVPMHPDLLPIIARRSKDRPATAYLFDDGLKVNQHGERSPAASKRFNYYREKVGVHEKPEGKRRSLVNFHSFRRWFSTRAVMAGQPTFVVREVVGHKQPKEDVTTSRYVTMGQLPEMKRACVEAVKLPVLAADEGP